MNVLSLFNGMSFGKMALESLNVPVTKYYSSEIDKYANQATQAMFPDTIQLGDVTQWRDWDIDWASVDLVTGGFPCQAWSMAGKQLGDKDERGMLFWTMLDIMKHVKYHNPKADFLIENVKMKKEFEQYITTHTENALGKVHKILINSALVSAQNRNRYYWTSFGVEQPEDKKEYLWDIIEDCFTDAEKSYCVGASYFKGGNPKSYFEKHRRQLVFCGAMRGRYIVNGKRQDSKQLTAGLTRQRIEVRYDGKTNSLTTVQKDNNVIYGCDGESYYSLEGIEYRKLTPRECFRLQTVPEHHIDTLLSAGISNTQLYKMCGNGFTMLVIKHILSHIK
jgi:DNA (cytosine-5)-methyltransferase 1/DNA (cytosine-5)-methyltransferase 3A